MCPATRRDVALLPSPGCIVRPEFHLPRPYQGRLSFLTIRALTLLYGLVAFGQIKFRRIDGHRELRSMLKNLEASAA